MAKIMFIVNEHPTEAFAISCAREAAERLRKAGHEIVWRKISPRNSYLGKIIFSRGKGKIRERALKGVPGAVVRNIEKWVRDSKPDAVYDFHCSRKDISHWNTYSVLAKNGKVSPASFVPADFTLETDWLYPELKLRTIEIKAVYRKLPKAMLAKIRKKAFRSTHEQGLPEHYLKYLTETTSHQLTRQAGLAPEKFGEAIATHIIEDLKPSRRGRVLPVGKMLRGIVKAGIIKRPFKRQARKPQLRRHR